MFSVSQLPIENTPQIRSGVSDETAGRSHGKHTSEEADDSGFALVFAAAYLEPVAEKAQFFDIQQRLVESEANEAEQEEKAIVVAAAELKPAAVVIKQLRLDLQALVEAPVEKSLGVNVPVEIEYVDVELPTQIETTESWIAVEDDKPITDPTTKQIQTQPLQLEVGESVKLQKVKRVAEGMHDFETGRITKRQAIIKTLADKRIASRQTQQVGLPIADIAAAVEQPVHIQSFAEVRPMRLTSETLGHVPSAQRVTESGHRLVLEQGGDTPELEIEPTIKFQIRTGMTDEPATPTVTKGEISQARSVTETAQAPVIRQSPSWADREISRSAETVTNMVVALDEPGNKDERETQDQDRQQGQRFPQESMVKTKSLIADEVRSGPLTAIQNSAARMDPVAGRTPTIALPTTVMASVPVIEGTNQQSTGLTPSRVEPQTTRTEPAQEALVTAKLQQLPNRTTLTVVVHDDHLGRVALQLVDRGGWVETVIRASDPHMAQTLSNATGGLLETLQQRGINTFSGGSTTAWDAQEEQRRDNPHRDQEQQRRRLRTRRQEQQFTRLWAQAVV